MTKIFLLLLLTACSTGQSLEKKIQGMSFLEKKSIPVFSRLEAKKYIQNQRNYLVLLFEQSRDPYYGTPKWSEECLRENIIGDVKEERQHIIFSSMLYFDKTGSAGFCSVNKSASAGQRIVIYCEGDKNVKDMSVLTTNELNLEKFNLCD